MKVKISFIFIFLISSFAFSQEEKNPVPVIVDSVSAYVDPFNDGKLDADSLLQVSPETSNTIYPKNLDPKFREKYKGNDFNYTTTKPQESLWERMMRKLRKIIESVFGEMDPLKASSIAQTVIRLIAIVVIGFILYFIIRYIIGKNGNLFFGKKNKKLNIETGDLHENIHEINFPESILQFEKQGDFRSAIRYHFLFVLKKLSDQKIIDWNPEKTNRDYYYELKTETEKEKYLQLAHIFDHVWYGEFDINETDYHYFKNQFQNSEL